MMVGFDLHQPASDAAKKKRGPNQVGRDLVDAPVEESFGETFRHGPSSQAANLLVNRCLTKSLLTQ
jgi:hypothetical protein